MPDASSLSLIAAIRSALEAARGVRTHDDLVSTLDRIAGVLAAALGYATVVVHLHRPAFDDFEVITVHGGPDVREDMLGRVTTWAAWAPFLASRFEARGTQHVPSGSLPGRSHMVPGPAVPSAGPGDWDPGDVVMVVMRRGNGDVLGFLRVDEPVDRRRPDDDRLDRLAAMGSVAGLAVEQALEARRHAEHRVALERLLVVSSQIADQRSGGGVLDAVCAGIRDALGFERTAVLLGEDRGLLRPAASAGWDRHDAVLGNVGFTVAELESILRPADERHGCYLLEHEDAEALLGLGGPVYRSQRNGHGPYAWDRHWLVVPLAGADGRMRGFIWVDDPADRLLPEAGKLQALRLFADQASAALETARELEASAHRAGHDPLTGLANRATLAERLRHALQRVRRAETSVALVFIDLDNFKLVNDTLGHGAGDELLRVIAARIDTALRPGDTVARFGGDEFVVLCEDVEDAAEAMEVAERLRALLALPVLLSAGTTQVTASLGVALPDRPDRSAEALMQVADRAMYEAKAAGRDASRLATPGASWS